MADEWSKQVPRNVVNEVRSVASLAHPLVMPGLPRFAVFSRTSANTASPAKSSNALEGSGTGV
jgi:hypothetical protein